MGFAISWLAVSGKLPQQVLVELGLACTGENEEIPESPVLAAHLPGDWFLIFANEFDSPLVADNVLQSLSTGCTVVSCQVEEHVMFSSSSCHLNGSETWHVSHDAQENIYQLSSRGQLPPQFNAIHALLRQEQDDAGGDKADVDYIHDVPIALAKAVTSFRHDEDIPGSGPEPFMVLADDATSKATKPWWKVW